MLGMKSSSSSRSGNDSRVKRPSLLHRALSAASFASSKSRRPKRLSFLLTCHAEHVDLLSKLVGKLRPSLPGCRLECGCIDEACRERVGTNFDAVYVVLYNPEQRLPEKLALALLTENWRYHLLAAAPNCCRTGCVGAELAHWRFDDNLQLQHQLGDLMYERVRDIQRIPCGSLDTRARS